MDKEMAAQMRERFASYPWMLRYIDYLEQTKPIIGPRIGIAVPYDGFASRIASEARPQLNEIFGILEIRIAADDGKAEENMRAALLSLEPPELWSSVYRERVRRTVTFFLLLDRARTHPGCAELIREIETVD